MESTRGVCSQYPAMLLLPRGSRTGRRRKGQNWASLTFSHVVRRKGFAAESRAAWHACNRTWFNYAGHRTSLGAGRKNRNAANAYWGISARSWLGNAGIGAVGPKDAAGGLGEGLGERRARRAAKTGSANGMDRGGESALTSAITTGAATFRLRPATTRRWRQVTATRYHDDYYEAKVFYALTLAGKSASEPDRGRNATADQIRGDGAKLTADIPSLPAAYRHFPDSLRRLPPNLPTRERPAHGVTQGMLPRLPTTARQHAVRTSTDGRSWEESITSNMFHS